MEVILYVNVFLYLIMFGVDCLIGRKNIGGMHGRLITCASGTLERGPSLKIK